MPESLLIKNIGLLVQTEELAMLKVCGKEMSELKTISDAYLLINNGLITAFGPMREIDERKINSEVHSGSIIDAGGRFVFPSFCDSHTHLVYAGSREAEYTHKIMGLSYEEIAKRGGGILNSARLLHNTSEDDLYQQSSARIREIIGMGTGAVEIKSGYGLNIEDELKCSGSSEG